jgi:hypothetical protein
MLFPGYYFMNSMLQTKARIESFERLCISKETGGLDFDASELSGIAYNRNDYIGKDV